MAWNDPQWGKKDDAGPPDLDELWKRFNQRLDTMFGGRGGGGKSGAGGNPANLAGLLVGLAFLALRRRRMPAVWAFVKTPTSIQR